MTVTIPNPGQDAETFAGLFERYKNLVYKTAYLMLGDRSEAEEALQEVFVLVFKSLSGYDAGRGAFSTWLHRITINYCLGHQRKRRLIVGPLEGTALVMMESEALETGLVKSFEKDRVRLAIKSLSPKQQAVVVLRYYWELPYSEISAILDIPLGTVKSRIDLAMRTLRFKLASHHNETLMSGSLSEEEVAP